MTIVRLAPIIVLCALLAACGVSFSSSEGNEFFDSLTIGGEKKPGAPLTMTVAVAQTYPLDVEIRCEVVEDEDVVKQIGAATVPAHPNGSPDATPVAQHYTFDFTVDAPGDYGVECYTPADEDNFIGKPLNIRV